MFQIEEFIKNCPPNLSGADFYSITNRARKICLKRLIESQSQSKITLDATNDLIYLKQEDFNGALVNFRPTLNEHELVNYEKYFNNLKNVIK